MNHLYMTMTIAAEVCRRPLDLPALAGIGFILAGALIVTLFSTSVRH